jgi:general stress protein YciG
MADNNPGNFANRPKEEVREIAAKGGRASHGGGNSGDSGADNSSEVSRASPSYL